MILERDIDHHILTVVAEIEALRAGRGLSREEMLAKMEAAYDALAASGLEPVNIPPERIARAQRLKRAFPGRRRS